MPLHRLPALPALVALVTGLTAAPTATAPASATPSPTATPSASCPELRLRSDLRNEGNEDDPGPLTRPNGPVYLHGTSDDPSATYRLERTRPGPAILRSGSGAATDWTVYPPENNTVRMRSTVRGQYRCLSNEVRIHVVPQLSLSVFRHVDEEGRNSYAFRGRVTPGRGQLVTLYRYRDSSRQAGVITAQGHVQPDGTYLLFRRFTGSGTFSFATAVSDSSSNTDGASRLVRVAVRP